MSITVGIVDYQMGNLRSVAKAIERVGGTAIVSSRPSELEKASHLILPGVGAFGDAIRELRQRDLVSWIQSWIAEEKPFLGICLGMQLLFDWSDEGGHHEGLSVLRGKVIRFDNSHESELAHRKIPHMGWNQVRSNQMDDPMMSGLSDAPYVYFVHSYYVVPEDPSVQWLTCEYGHPFCAAVRFRNLMATQFHPEKSQGNGLQMLRNFLQTSSSHELAFPK